MTIGHLEIDGDSHTRKENWFGMTRSNGPTNSNLPHCCVKPITTIEIYGGYILDNRNYIKWIRSKVGHEKIILAFAGGCIFNERGEVLLQKRTDSSKWGFPGGAIELGETPQIAAVREVKEETGLDVEAGKLLGIYTDLDMEYPNGDKAQSILLAFELKVIGGELSCDKQETLELKYFPVDDVPDLFCKQHEELLQTIQSR